MFTSAYSTANRMMSYNSTCILEEARMSGGKTISVLGEIATLRDGVFKHQLYVVESKAVRFILC